MRSRSTIESPSSTRNTTTSAGGCSRSVQGDALVPVACSTNWMAPCQVLGGALARWHAIDGSASTSAAATTSQRRVIVLRGFRLLAELTQDGFDVLLGVAEEHAGVGFVEEGVVDAGVAAGHAALHDDGGARLP